VSYARRIPSLPDDIRSRSPIDVFVTYDGKRAEDIAVSRYAVRQLVATEVCDFRRI
jgi:hypothetical protein